MKEIRFLRSLQETTRYGKIFKVLSERIHRDSDRRVVFKFREFGRREIGEIVRCLPDKKFRLALQLSLLRVSRPKSVTASHQECYQIAPDFIQIGSLSAELYPNA